MNHKLKSLYKKNRIFSLFLIVLIITTIFKFIYVFALTEYTSYLVSDMGGYWQRAIQRFQGDLYDINQWVIWPPFFHILLANIFKVTQFLGVFKHNLEIVLSINILLSSISVFYLYLLTLKLSKNDKIAFTASTLYALTYHAIYFNASILSENFAVPLVIASIYFLFCNKWKYYILSGLLLALATGIRPGYGLFGLPFALYALVADSKNLKSDWKQTFFFRGIIKAGLFSIGFFLIIFFIVSEIKDISGGKVNSLAASSGINYYFSFTKKYEVGCRFDGYYYVLIPPGTVRNPENGKLITNAPIYDTKYFKTLANRYIKENPKILFTKIKDIWDLYFGVLFPSFPSAKGFDFFIKLFKVIFFILTLLTFFSLFTRPKKRVNFKNYLLLMSLIFLSIITCYMFNSEHRYVFGFIFATYPPAFEMIFELKRNIGSYTKKIIIFVSLLSLPLIGVKSAFIINKLNMVDNMVVEIREYDNPDKMIVFNIDQVNFPFRKQLTHKTLGKTGQEGRFFMMVTGEFDMLQSGYVEFYLYCEEGTMLSINDNRIIFREGSDDEKELKKRIFLERGRYSFKIVYKHLSNDAGIKAMYIPLSFDGNKYFFGQDTEYMKF